MKKTKHTHTHTHNIHTHTYTYTLTRTRACTNSFTHIHKFFLFLSNNYLLSNLTIKVYRCLRIIYHIYYNCSSLTMHNLLSYCDVIETNFRKKIYKIGALKG